MDLQACPPDPEELSERYCLGLLSPEETRIFEDHYLTCPRCAEVLAETDRYVKAMQEAAREIRRKELGGS